MKYVFDIHIHSKYSRATSRELGIEGLYKGAAIKGIDVIGTGDFTHPRYFKEIEKELEDIGSGFYSFKRKNSARHGSKKIKKDPKFLLSAEIANIYKKSGKARRVHTCVFAPSVAAAKELNIALEKIGNIKSDGRPILGIDVEDMTRIIFEISEDFIVVPAHAWTPWFSVFGSKSGFDSIEECFGDQSKKIFAIETGLSSDPVMNRTWSYLDNISLISNSDAHSLPNLGREATVFDLESLSIKNMRSALDKKNFSDKKNKIDFTIEFFPEEGKYHLDGHKDCSFSCDPKETKKLKALCPKCGRGLTVGVLSRVADLGDRKESLKLENYKHIVPLREIIADAFGQAKSTKRVCETYDAMIDRLGDEFSILLDLDLDEIKSFGIEELSEGIKRVRRGEIFVKGGYDGEYGVVSVFSEKEKISAKSKQKSLF